MYYYLPVSQFSVSKGINGVDGAAGEGIDYKKRSKKLINFHIVKKKCKK